LRHSKPRTTQNIYIKANIEAARDAVRKVGAAYTRKVVPIKKVRPVNTDCIIELKTVIGVRPAFALWRYLAAWVAARSR